MKTQIQTLDRYKANLQIVGCHVYSYDTHVATIEGKYLIVLGYYSPTTTKHINYVVDKLNLIKSFGY